MCVWGASGGEEAMEVVREALRTAKCDERGALPGVNVQRGVARKARPPRDSEGY